ncbi:nitroreductase [Variovorax sp. JS1663]|uniref:nitroreductase n=1 Tax=Variovorax sp. JS1663 TaxID=1851577 RepID=UPI000B349269|nr:nitroreductase [Variovorax sp. JS1663]OUL99272.1 nitroreductase [Variovorax sp. JS1663]
MSTPDVLAALHARRSIRGFLPDPVEHRLVEAVLADAARSPSASNTQPWKVHVCAGEARDRLSRALLEAHEAGGDGHAQEYAYYPSRWQDPYLARRRKVGKDLYGLLGIGKGDTEAMARQYGRNYEFFGAPVGLFFTLDRGLDGQAPWLDLGMYLHGVMLAALGHGLATCAQQAFARYHAIVRAQLAIPPSEILVCGMAMGYPDAGAPANRLDTAREPVSGFAHFHRF